MVWRGRIFHADEKLVSFVRIGNNNIFREGSTVHRGTAENTETVIGNGCMLMSGAHAAHNVRIGNNVVMVNNAVVGGYGEIDDNVILSGNTAVHQFCRMGKFSMMSGGSAYSKDIPPYMIAAGRNSGVEMVNLVGLKRNGFFQRSDTGDQRYFPDLLLFRALFEQRFGKDKKRTAASAGSNGVCPLL